MATKIFLLAMALTLLLQGFLYIRYRKYSTDIALGVVNLIGGGLMLELLYYVI